MNAGREQRRAQSLKLGAAAQTLPIVVGYGAQLLTTPYVLLELGLHNFGIWSITGAVAQYGALLDLGVSRAASRYVAHFHAKGDRRGEGSVLGICIIVLLALGAVLTALAMTTSRLMNNVLGTGDPALARLLLLCAVEILIAGLVARVLAAASVARGRHLPANVSVATLSTLQALGGVAALAMWHSLAAFALGTATGTFIGLLIVMVTILIDEHRIIISMPNMPLARDILSYGIKSQIAAAGDLFLLQSGKLVAGVIVGPTAAGVYELAMRLAMGAQVLGAASASALTPHLTRSYALNGFDGILSQYEQLTRKNTAVALLMPFVMVATAFSAIPLWLNDDNMSVIWLLLALLPGIAINVSTSVCSSTLMAIGRPEIIAYVTVTGGLVQTVLTIALGHAFGFPGIALAFGIGVPVAKFAGLWYMQARAGIPQTMYVRAVRGPFFIGAVALAIVLPIGYFTSPHDRDSAVWPFLGTILLFASIYIFVSAKRGYLPTIKRKPQTRRGPLPETGRHRHRGGR